MHNVIIKYIFLNLSYPIAIAFKIIGRARTEEQALELGNLYKSFIDKLSLSIEKKKN